MKTDRTEARPVNRAALDFFWFFPKDMMTRSAAV